MAGSILVPFWFPSRRDPNVWFFLGFPAWFLLQMLASQLHPAPFSHSRSEARGLRSHHPRSRHEPNPGGVGQACAIGNDPEPLGMNWKGIPLKEAAKNQQEDPIALGVRPRKDKQNFQPAHFTSGSPQIRSNFLFTTKTVSIKLSSPESGLGDSGSEM